MVAAGSMAQVREAAGAAMGALRARGVRVARVLPDTRRATQVAKRLAGEGVSLLGTPVTTLDGWALERWALFGDGRTPAFSAERRALVLQAIDEARPRTTHLPTDARGIVSCVESMVRTATGTLAFDQGVVLDTERLSEAQSELLDICHVYARLLAKHGLIERSAALASLPDAMGDAGWSHLLLEDVSELGAVQESLVAEAARHEGVTLVVRWHERNEGDAARAEMARLVARVNEGGNDARVALDELLGRLHPSYAKVRGLVEGLVERQGLAVRLVRADELAGAMGAGREANPAKVDSTIPDAASPSETTAGPTAPRSELAALRHALFQPSTAPTVVPTGAVRFVLPAGRYARSEALACELIRLRGSGIAPRDIVLACADPLAMADELAGRLACADIACVASGIEPLALSNAGRALTGLVRLVEAEARTADTPASEELVALAGDLALNPLLGLSPKDAHKAAHALDASWRANRLASATDLLRGLAGASATASTAIKSLRTGDLAGAVAVLYRHSKRQAGPAGDARAAADRLRDEPGLASLAHRVSVAAELSGPLPVSSDVVARLIDGASVRASRLTVPPNSLDAMREAAVLKSNPNAVCIVRLGDVAGKSARAVVICDLTANAYPFSERSDAASSLLGKLGLPAPARATDELRWQLATALEAASEVVVLERPLSDERAEPLRPSALFEEIVDCYRDDITAQDDLDAQTGLPLEAWTRPQAPGQPPLADLSAVLAPALGEEEFAALVSPVGALDRALTEVPAPQLLLRDDGSSTLLTREDLVMSPSGLELYLRCPARWFFERRLPSNGLDAAFDPLARGTFCHAVLQRFHERFADATGLARIPYGASPDDAEVFAEPDRLLDACFDEVRDRARACARSGSDEAGNALVAASPLEEQALENIRQELRACIRRDALIPPAYVPCHHEWKFGDSLDAHADEPASRPSVPYAGIRLNGIIDRVDVDGQGHALVIDYKGGLGSGYELPRPKKGEDELPEGTDPLLPLHSQALMYATALMRDVEGERLTPTGALYLSYAQNAIRGFVDPGAFAPASAMLLPEKGDPLSQGVLVQPEPNGSSGLLALLAHAEDVAAKAVGRLRDGDIEPSPRFGTASCDRCPLTTCPKRVK